MRGDGVVGIRWRLSRDVALVAHHAGIPVAFVGTVLNVARRTVGLIVRDEFSSGRHIHLTVVTRGASCARRFHVNRLERFMTTRT